MRGHEISDMDLKDFEESLDRNTPPEDLGRALQALWYQAKGEWDNRDATPGGRRKKSQMWENSHFRSLGAGRIGRVKRYRRYIRGGLDR